VLPPSSADDEDSWGDDATALSGALRASAGPATLPVLPGYEVLGELGCGGMGVVYKARDTRLKRLVALKMILAGDAGPRHVARFRAEAEAVARLSHPNIVQIHEIGEHDGRPYFSLELVEGGSLDRAIQGVPKPTRAAAALVRRLALAMHSAHERGVIHRDLKPALLGGCRRPAPGMSRRGSR
jgi:serine/threonine-protein kinase